MDQIPIPKSEIPDDVDLEALIFLYNCRLIDQDEYYYYVEGEYSNLEEFSHAVSKAGSVYYA